MKTDVKNPQHPAASDSDETVDLTRRGFMVSTALAAAGASAAGLLKPTAAAAAAPDPKKSYGHGPFPAEGMALYSQGPHQRMKFQRRFVSLELCNSKSRGGCRETGSSSKPVQHVLACRRGRGAFP